MRRHILFILTVAGGLLCGCGGSRKQTPPPVPQIQVAGAVREKVPRRMQFTGQTYSMSDATLMPRVSGYLAGIYYQDGMPVEKGQMLIKIDSRPMQVEINSAQATLAAARAQLVEAQNNYNRSVPLARINAISQSALDQATATLESAQASVRSAEASLRNASLDMSYTSIHAPISGVIGETNGTIGDYVGPGTNNTIINTISNIDTVVVHLSLPAATYFSVLEHDSLDRPIYMNADLLSDIDMYLPDGTLYPYKGTYQFTERAIDNQSGSIVLRVIFPNPEHLLKPGQYARVEANVGPARDVVLIPQRAVRQTQNVNSVYVAVADTVQYRQVTLGDTYGTNWAVTSGIEPGERVLVEGLQKVRQGSRIQPVPVADSTVTSSVPHTAVGAY